MNTVELTDTELLALQYALDNWVLTSSAKGNAPFYYYNCQSISKKIGESPSELWEDPICAAWYKDRNEKYDECQTCSEPTLKTDLKQYKDEEIMCPECLKKAESD